MNAENFSLEMLMQMKHSPIHNYILPGLTSSLIGSPSPQGTMRIFEVSRDCLELVTPHSHRFDFQCWVLRGHVHNLIWTCKPDTDESADFYQESDIEYKDKIGGYEKYPGAVRRWKYETKTYKTGECYSMKSEEVHSIFFRRNAIVLFFEGPQKTKRSTVIEPFVNGKTIPTLTVEDWMFKP